MKTYTLQEIIEDRRAKGREIAGVPPELTAADFALAGEDFANHRLLVTITDWARLVNRGADLVPIDLTRQELTDVKAAIERILAVHGIGKGE